MNHIGNSLCIALLVASSGRSANAQWTTIDLSLWANARIQNYQPGASAYPEGQVVLGGVPFNIQSVGGNNAWNAQNVSGPYPHVLDMPIGICGATEVHTLINTFCGQPGPTSYIKLEFFGSLGAYHQKDLIGNADVRDHLQSGWTNTINNTTTINVFTTTAASQSNRLDKQRIVLPAAFANQRLTSMRITSTGGPGVSDASLQGLTVLSSSAAACGQANSPCASLVVNGVGSSGSGPFLASAPSGTTLSLTWSGAAGQPLALLASPTLTPGQAIGFGLVVDLNLAQASVLFGGLDPMSRLLFSTDSSLGAFGVAAQNFLVPAAAAGSTLRVQGVVFDLAGQCTGPGFMTTASFEVHM